MDETFHKTYKDSLILFMKLRLLFMFISGNSDKSLINKMSQLKSNLNVF